MQAFYCDQFVLPLPEGHRFPMRKYALLRDAALAAGVLAPDALFIPEAATEDELVRAHDAAYVRKVFGGGLTDKEIRRLGFPWSPQLVERSRRSVGGTIQACRAALRDGVAVNLAGGTHHAFPDYGAGFCVFNDVAVAARAMLAEGRAARIAVVDCDVHQGDGTAAIFAGDPAVFTFSIHGARNFPFHKQASDLDVELPDGAGDAAYLDALRPALAATLAHARPELVIYVAGADPYEGDRLGLLKLSKAGLAERDRLVLEGCAGQGIPVAVVMGGGYARAIEDVVCIHLATIRAAAAVGDGAR